MLPYIHIGTITISAYYTAMIAGYAAMVVLMLLKSRREKYGLHPTQAFLFATAELIVGVLGCKLLYILENIAWIHKNGMTLGGFSFYGAVFLILLLMPLIGRLLRMNAPDSLDHAAVCITAMLAAIRIGCFLNGCCGGRVFSVGDFYFTLPTQLIECICDFGILSFLLKCEKRNKAGSLLYPVFMLLYGSARFLIEFLRNTPKDWLGLSHAHWFSAASILIAACFLLFQANRPGSLSSEGN